LQENGIRDGDLLLLTPVSAHCALPASDDVIAEMASALDTHPRWTPTTARVAGCIVMPSCWGLVTFTLLRLQPQPAGYASVLALGLLCAASLVAGLRSDIRAILSCCAIGYAALTGYLLVPGEAEPPKIMLAGAVCATAAVVAAYYSSGATAVFTAVGVFGYLSAAAACADMFLTASVGAAGAMLAVAAIAMVALSARAAIWVSRLPVPRPSVDGGDRAHAILTGLVCGSCVAAVVGTALAASEDGHEVGAFALAVAVALVLRASTHVDLVQAAALVASGTACFGVVFFWAVRTWPQQSSWISLAAVGMAMVVVVRHLAPHSRRVSPVVRRCVELSEYVALAALIPLACWVCGVFGTVRGLG